MNNNFLACIRRAKDKGSLDLARRVEMERQMASALVRHALKTGLNISVNDGEEIALEHSTSYAQIFDALFTTDEDYLILYSPDKTRIGWFHLIYGNDGYDVIANYVANDACEKIWNEVIMPLSDKLEKKARG